MTRLAGSRFDLAKICPASMVLPGVADTSEAAEAGKAKHKYLETGCLQDVDEKYRDDCASIALEFAVPPAAYLDMRECLFQLTVDSRGLLVERIGEGWDHSKITGMPVIVDRVFSGENGTIFVVDYKTGHDEPDPKSLQLAVAAFCVHKEFDAQEVTAAMVHIHHNGYAKWLTHTYSAFDFYEIEQTVLDVIARVESARTEWQKGIVPDVRAGGHCRYCPARLSCPTTTALARQLLAQGELQPQDMIRTLNPIELGEAWVKLKLAKAFVEGLDKAMRERIEDLGGLDLPDGRKLVPQAKTVRSLDVQKALPVLMGMGIMPTIKESISVGAVDAAAKEAGKKPKEIREVWDLLVKADAVKASTITSFVTKKVKDV
jgi:hypothetical protein